MSLESPSIGTAERRTAAGHQTTTDDDDAGARAWTVSGESRTGP
ncbi:hypothetical protein ACI79G_10205 [Geodermatophilus sp. SYSU D00779]